ncbi:TDP-4-oxo-6-deoxy-D-glucose transaminase [Hyella patelloides LEGE 07179]|uniref:TDP-4-oxo-6-deoxy-D-glucose transaminase n=1 Tax=Hyella patelloides LEGE 07179 TaxID=945734 RepID=A0A563W406_9CYAN|nr:dTDP-4-amino-4,6-dideoxygalactose transaminase [Hyella patelloides]VEP18395.1 TDP-4-oxo-6-deoxy-D-glucose transaminase [Hyella patelloides LEGE 07179]
MNLKELYTHTSDKNLINSVVAKKIQQKKIPFNKPFITGREFGYIKQAIANSHFSGNGHFTKKCQTWLEKNVNCQKALLTHSCTAALEMAAILANIQPGDEVIMPSYTFVSTANAFVLRGGIPVFVDIRPDTLNIDESKIEAAITSKTKAIIPVHYGGIGCDMTTIMEIAQTHNLLVIEDAAQGIMSKEKNRPLGSIGHLGAMSFHATKNIICGEGGALLINHPEFIERAEIIWEKGTNRSQFFQGKVDKYTWVDMGSSYLPSEINAAFLLAQLESAELITQKRLNLWQQYHRGFAELEKEGKLRRPFIPNESQQNAHIYYIILPDSKTRTTVIKKLKSQGISSVFHYIPLHSSPYGQKCSYTEGNLEVTEDLSTRLLRLPLFPGLTEYHVELIVDLIYQFL